MRLFDRFKKRARRSSDEPSHAAPQVTQSVGERGRRYKVGDRIGGRYQIYRILGGEGQSGMGVVYVCLDRETRDVLALKTFQDKYL